MLDRALFAVRRFRLEIGSWLGSWKLSIVLMVLAALYYVLLAIWAGSSPPHVVRNIASLLPYWLLYLLILINTGTCFWRRLALLERDLRPGPEYRNRPPGWTFVLPREAGPEEARIALARAGYRVRSAALPAAKGRWSALGSYLFHASFFVVALSFLATLALRTETTIRVAEGEELMDHPSGLQFSVQKITPEFWQDQMLFTLLEADLVWADGRRSTTRINRPVMVGSSSFMRLSGFGYVPRYELLDRDGSIVDSAWVKMNLFPPGLRDWFRAEGYPHRFYMSIVPDPEQQDGRFQTRSLNLNDPVIDLEVYRGHLNLGAGSLRTGETFEFEGLVIRIAEIRYWGEFSVVRDPGALPLFAGFALGLLGLVLRLPGKRSEAEFRPASEDTPPQIVGWGERPADLEQRG